MLNDKEKSLIELVETHCHLCDEEAQSEIKHNLGVDEWEKAYEILLVELIGGNIKPDNFDKDVWWQYLVDFGIVEDPVIDADLSEKFKNWADS